MFGDLACFFPFLGVGRDGGFDVGADGGAEVVMEGGVVRVLKGELGKERGAVGSGWGLHFVLNVPWVFWSNWLYIVKWMGVIFWRQGAEVYRIVMRGKLNRGPRSVTRIGNQA